MRVTLTLSCRASIAICEVIQRSRGTRRLTSLFGTVRQLVRESDRRLLPGFLDSDEEDEAEDLEAPQPPWDPQEVTRR